MITVTVPCVAAHLLVAPQPCKTCGEACFWQSCPTGGWWIHETHPSDDHDAVSEMGLRFLPTDADTECETCCGSGVRRCSLPRHHSGPCDVAPLITDGLAHCLSCGGEKRRPLRAGDRIAIQADDDVPELGSTFGPWTLHTDGSYYLSNGVNGDVLGLRPGEVVGYATVTRVLPITRRLRSLTPHIYVTSRGRVRAYNEYDRFTDLSDHLDAGLVFTPGQVALELTDVESGG